MTSNLLKTYLIFAMTFVAAGLNACASDLTAIAHTIDEQCAAGTFSGIVSLKIDGTTVLDKACGYADRSRHVPITRATRFKIFSVSKPITATVIGRLIDSGKLRLTDRASAFIPAIPSRWKSITVQQLLEHTSGIPDLTQALLEAYLHRPESGWEGAMHEVLTSSASTDLVSPAGIKWSYNNFGYELLALIGSVAGNKPFDRLAVDLFRDAGMRDAEMARALVTNGVVDSAPSKGLALGYACEKDGGEPTSSYSFVQLGAGAVYASAPDLMNLDDALRKGPVLSQRFQRLTIADAFPVNEAVNYGYGWMVRHVNDHAYLQHGGGNNGYVTEFARGVDRAVTLVIMSNDSCAPVGELRARIMEAVLS